jgi:DNA-binding transcriptional LysR family regulator
MELFSMTCFVTLAKYQKFFDAAEALYLSQSSLSKHISALERELGVRLVTRNLRCSVLTDAGREFLPYAESITGEYVKVTGLLDSYKKTAQKRLTIYTHSFLSQYGYSDMLIRFQKLYPDILLEINELDSISSLQRVFSDPSNICIVFSETDTLSDKLEHYRLMDDELVLLVTAGHPFAELDSVSLSMLRGEKIQIMLERQETFLYAFILQQFGRAGFSPLSTTYGLWCSSIPELLRRNNLLSIMPRKIAESSCGGDIKLLPISGTDKLSLQLIKDKDNNTEMARLFFDFVRDRRPQSLT